MINLYSVQFSQRSRNLQSRSDVSNGLGGNPFLADCCGQRKFREEGRNEIDPAIAKRPMLPDNWKIRRLWNRSIYCQEARNFIVEILLVYKTRFGSNFYQNARMALFVAPTVKVVPGMFLGHMAPALFGQ